MLGVQHVDNEQSSPNQASSYHTPLYSSLGPVHLHTRHPTLATSSGRPLRDLLAKGTLPPAPELLYTGNLMTAVAPQTDR